MNLFGSDFFEATLATSGLPLIYAPATGTYMRLQLEVQHLVVISQIPSTVTAIPGKWLRVTTLLTPGEYSNH